MSPAKTKRQRDAARRAEKRGRVFVGRVPPPPPPAATPAPPPHLFGLPAVPEDLWRHRSDRMRCQTCIFYVPKGGPLGRCRRHAPSLSGWPAVFRQDWCGDHKLDETKL